MEEGQEKESGSKGVTPTMASGQSATVLAESSTPGNRPITEVASNDEGSKYLERYECQEPGCKGYRKADKEGPKGMRRHYKKFHPDVKFDYDMLVLVKRKVRYRETGPDRRIASTTGDGTITEDTSNDKRSVYQERYGCQAPGCKAHIKANTRGRNRMKHHYIKSHPDIRFDHDMLVIVKHKVGEVVEGWLK